MTGTGAGDSETKRLEDWKTGRRQTSDVRHQTSDSRRLKSKVSKSKAGIATIYTRDASIFLCAAPPFLI